MSPARSKAVPTAKSEGDRADGDFAHAELSPAQRRSEEKELGRPGAPINRRTPFFIGLTGFLGVAVAYVMVRTVFDAGEVLSLIGLSLFLAMGLDPAVVWLSRHRVPRWGAVVIVVAVLAGVVAGFVAAAILPISREVHQLSINIPHYEREIRTGHGWIGRLAKELHVNTDLKSAKTSKLVSLSVVGGVLGAGKVILSAVASVAVVIALTIYFLVALPGVRRLFLRLMPATRRDRATALTDEITSRVGGFVLGNLLTSLVAGVGTALWLSAFGVPYPILLGLLVALLDLIPVVGSSIGGVIASAVALTKGLPIALATVAFYIIYRLFEDYLLTPRVMRHTVKISPGLTIIATLIGGVLLGLIGALIAIPTAAAINLLLEEIAFPSLERR
jgi:predicted PurR-regulated permease PerM